jgi:hypothetical protein
MHLDSNPLQGHEPMGNAPQPQEDEPYFCYSATLRISGTIPSLQEITDNLGLAPTHLHRAGEVRSPGAKPYQHDLWAYEPLVDETEPLHAHIDSLWRAIRPHKDYLIRLKEQFKVDVFLGYRSNSGTAGVEVPYQSLEMFTELQVPLGLSIIIT